MLVTQRSWLNPSSKYENTVNTKCANVYRSKCQLIAIACNKSGLLITYMRDMSMVCIKSEIHAWPLSVGTSYLIHLFPQYNIIIVVCVLFECAAHFTNWTQLFDICLAGFPACYIHNCPHLFTRLDNYKHGRLDWSGSSRWQMGVSGQGAIHFGASIQTHVFAAFVASTA